MDQLTKENTFRGVSSGKFYRYIYYIPCMNVYNDKYIYIYMTTQLNEKTRLYGKYC